MGYLPSKATLNPKTVGLTPTYIHLILGLKICSSHWFLLDECGHISISKMSLVGMPRMIREEIGHLSLNSSHPTSKVFHQALHSREYFHASQQAK